MIVASIFLAACAGMGWIAVNEPAIYLRLLPGGLLAGGAIAALIAVYSVGYSEGRWSVVNAANITPPELTSIWAHALPVMAAILGLILWSLVLVLIAQAKKK